MHSGSSLVTSTWLQANITSPTVKIIDATWHLPGGDRDALQEYAAGHLPGAVFFELAKVAAKDSPLPHTLPKAEDFAAFVGALGISSQDTVILYDDSNVRTSARLWWMFRAFGHENVAVLDGGLKAWKAAGGMLTTDVVTPAPVQYEAELQEGFFGDWQDAFDTINDASRQLVDARGTTRFEGSTPEAKEGLRAGHIPGAVNIPFMSLYNEDGTMKTPDTLKDIMQEGSVSLDKPLVLSCGSGITACVLALALDQVGKNDISVYDGSWSEWGMRTDLPIETGKAR